MNDTTNLVHKLSENIEKVILGKPDVIRKVIIALICDGHILIDDIPGVGKTALVSSLAKTIDARFRRIQFTPDVLPSDVTGFSLLNKQTNTFEFSPGAIFTNILLVDEINRASAKTQSSLLEAMEENQVTVDGHTYKLMSPFMVLATQNPVETSGTYSLPEAQLDRFLMKISIGYPMFKDEIQILDKYKSENPITTLANIASTSDILMLQNRVRNVFVNDDVKSYILNIVVATRNNEALSLGVSPRGTLALLRASSGVAVMHDRDFIIPDDVKEIASSVLSHRIILTPSAKLKKITPEKIIADIISNVSVKVSGYDKK